MHTFAQKPKATQPTTSANSAISSPAHFEQSCEVDAMLHLQRTVGNQAAQRILQTNEEPKPRLIGTASSRFGYEFSRIPIHPPTTGAIREKPGADSPRDQHEQEPDRLAEQVTRMPAPLLQLSGARGGARAEPQTEQQVSELARLRTTPLEPGDLGHTVAPPIVQEQAQPSRGVLETAPRFLGNQPTSTSWDFSRIPLYPSSARAQRLPGPIQRKLKVGAIDDPLEHEADRVADQVMRMPAADAVTISSPPQASRKCEKCDEEEKLQKKETGPQTVAGDAPAGVHETLRSAGQPLDMESRAFFEPRLGADLSQVRVHSDTRAAESAHSVYARAYTVANHVVFGRDQYAPHSAEGRHLLAHELTHTLQQQGGMPSLRREPPNSPPPAPPDLETRLKVIEETGPATRARLDEIIRTGGPIPDTTDGAKVIGAAIIDIEAYEGPKEMRAINGLAGDRLGQGAPVYHATSPTTRTLSVTRGELTEKGGRGPSILGPRKESINTHENDAEMKLFEDIISRLPKNAKGTIYFTTVRVPKGQTVLEPVPACSGCIRASFETAGIRGFDLVSHAPAPPPMSTGPLGDPPTGTGGKPGAGGGDPAPKTTEPPKKPVPVSTKGVDPAASQKGAAATSGSPAKQKAETQGKPADPAASQQAQTPAKPEDPSPKQKTQTPLKTPVKPDKPVVKPRSTPAKSTGTAPDPGGQPGKVHSSSGGATPAAPVKTGFESTSKNSPVAKALGFASWEMERGLGDWSSKLMGYARANGDKDTQNAVDQIEKGLDAYNFIKDPKNFVARKGAEYLLEKAFRPLREKLGKAQAEFDTEFPDVAELHQNWGTSRSLEEFRQAYQTALASVHVPEIQKAYMYTFVAMSPPDKVDAVLKEANEILKHLPTVDPYLKAYKEAEAAYLAALTRLHGEIERLREELAGKADPMTAQLRPRAAVLLDAYKELEFYVGVIENSPAYEVPLVPYFVMEMHMLDEQMAGLAGGLNGFADTIDERQQQYAAELERVNAEYNRVRRTTPFQ